MTTLPPKHAPAIVLDVLVAEDDLDCLESIAEAVESMGHSCRKAHDGAEAWEMYQAAGANVILSDWNMPRMTGIELCARVRGAASNTLYTHFVFVTANDDPPKPADALRAGADDYLSKPLDLAKLQARLESIQSEMMRRRTPKG